MSRIVDISGSAVMLDNDVADEIERLRAEVERKDQRIEELEAVLGTIRDAANIHLGANEERGDMSDVCKHGSLARSCEICERDKVIDRLRAEVERLQTIVDHYHQAQSALVRKERGDE